MCGLAGIFRFAGVGQQDVDAVKAMNRAQKHRGPDAEGLWSDRRCVLGHRRLSIIDLSDAGTQPFFSPDKRHVLVFNGEIYNYIELREELRALGRTFATATDTEVLLAAYLEYGEACLDRLNGMFAFALYDVEKGALFLARDRMGVKPLYYAMTDDGALVFASELKALAAVCPPGAPNLQSVFEYLVFNRTDIREETFFTGFARLPKGCRAVFSREGLDIRQWWEPGDYLGRHADETPNGAAAAARTVEELFESAVRLRMRSDVPVGSCLSGGLDSSVLVGMLFSRVDATRDFPTFTASFPGLPQDETAFVELLRKKYPFAMNLTRPTAEKALGEIRAFVRANDEPVTSFSFYAQYDVMRLARERDVTVLLDGQGGDEVFAGYQYFHGFYLYGLLRSGKLGAFSRELAAVLRRRQHVSALQALAFQTLPGSVRAALLRRHFPFLRRDFFDACLPKSRISNEFFDARGLNESLVRHFRFKLEHLLRMEDRNSMAFSIETRLPYLDYRLVEYVLGLPESLKIGGGETKKLQKAALGRYAIPEIVDRKDKIGFGPMGLNWRRTPGWKELAEKSREDLALNFPEVFARDFHLPGNFGTLWKLMQLSLWREAFFS